LSFGALKVVSSYCKRSVIPTALELAVGIGLAIISYYVGLLRYDYPEIYPLFFQVDLLPPILEFIFRSEVYLYLLSLLPLWQAVSLVRFALDIRQSVQLGDQKFGTSTTVRNSLATAAVELLLAIVATLRQLAKVARLQALHHLMAQEIVSLSLISVSLVLLFYLLIYVTITIIKEQYDLTYVPGMDLLRILSSFVLLESMSGEPLKDLYFQIWAFLILLLTGVLYGSQISLLFLSGIVIIVFYRFSTTFLASLRHHCVGER